jgi:tRNA(fMet)-specific endonuclease VapC
VLDSSIAIAAERQKLPLEGLLKIIWDAAGHTKIGMSTVSVMELEHGIWRAEDDQRAHRRRQFLEDLIGTVPVYPITTELARSAGRIDAEQQRKGVRIALADLLIGVTALDLGYAVATHNTRHFLMIPGLEVKQF